MAKNGTAEPIFESLCGEGPIVDDALATFKSGPLLIDSDIERVRAVIHAFLSRVRGELKAGAAIVAVESYDRIGLVVEQPLDCDALRPGKRAAALTELIDIVREFLLWRQQGWDTIALFPPGHRPRFKILDIVDDIDVTTNEIRGAAALAAKLRPHVPPPEPEPEPDPSDWEPNTDDGDA